MRILEINIAASFNQLVRDESAPIFGRCGECRVPIVCRNIYVAARSNELLRDGCMPFAGSDVERRPPIL